jgi:hypothetical protein
MHISPWLIYFWQLADKVVVTSAILTIVTLLFCLIFTVVSAAETEHKVDEWCKTHRKSRRPTIFRSLITGITLLLFSVATPSSKTIALMVVVPQLVDSKIIQQDLPDIYNLAVDTLKSELSVKKENK